MKAKKERKAGLPDLAPKALAADDSEQIKGGLMRSEPASGDGGGGTGSGGVTAGPAPAATTDATTALMASLNKAAQAQQDLLNSLSIVR